MGSEVIIAPRADVVREDFLPVFTVNQAVERKKQINQFIEQVLTPENDYGVIPGVNSKPVLLKPGAEKLCSIFGLAPCYEAEEVTEDWSGEHHNGEPFFYYRYKCRLFRQERCLGEAVGSCSSWETKYRWRESKRKCPECGQTSIIAGKAEFGGGWLCWKKQGGCGNKYEANDPQIVGQAVGRVPNPDVADQVNTIQKMAQKRALVAAVLVVTNCSDAFTQDLEDIDTGGAAKGTQAAADAVAQRKIADIESKRANGWPAEVALYIKGFSEAGGMERGFKFIQDELAKTEFPEANEVYLELATKLRDRYKGRGVAVDDAQRTALALWSEVERFRKMKAEREQEVSA